MPLNVALNDFQVRTAQCDQLIANAHRNDPSGAPLHPQLDKQQITVAAFLNLFIAWESFLEDVITKLMSGSPTISGTHPVRYVMPASQDAAKQLVIGINRYFDYANFDYVKRMVNMYFENGYPLEPTLSSITSQLADLRTMRNASAHITSTTQRGLEALAQRIFSTPRPGIDLYTLLTAPHPGASAGATVYSEARDKLLTAALIIATG